MTRKIMFAALVGASAMAAVSPAGAVALVAGTSSGAPTAYTAVEGTFLQSLTQSDVARTFAATLRAAVYRLDSGFLDFYFQVERTGAGTRADQMIERLTLSNFGGGFLLDGGAAALDPDLAGFFTAANNPPENGNPAGSTTTVNLSADGQVVEFAFGQNGLTGTQTSATYRVRTTATAYNALGSFGIIDGSSIEGDIFQPTAAVPEPATWGLMILGFGLIGAASRRARRVTGVLA